MGAKRGVEHAYLLPFDKLRDQSDGTELKVLIPFDKLRDQRLMELN